MLKILRLKLTFLYLISAILLALAVGGGTYSLVSYYFQTTTDEALKIKMGLQFAASNIPLPVELYSAVRKAGLVITNPPQSRDSVQGNIFHESDEGIQEFELSDIYVFPLNNAGSPLEGYSSVIPSSLIDSKSINQAMIKGYDLRTVKFANGTSARILTYKIPGDFAIKYFQVGRYLTLQHIVLRQLLNTMIILGAVITVIIGAAAWFLAGRTLAPAQQAWEKQQIFVANASHELRAPLTLIRAGVEVAQREPKGDKQNRVLNDVLADADYMNQLIEGLLLLSRLDAQALEIKVETLDLKSAFQPILRQLKLMTTEKEISLVSDIPAIQVLADPMRLKQIFLIIVDNAMRHTAKGGQISITAGDDGKMAYIKISDTGTGIPDEHIGRVFDRFYKVSHGSVKDGKTSGLGLSIAKSLVEAHRGSITIRNLKPHGIEVRVELPTDRLTHESILTKNRK